MSDWREELLAQLRTDAAGPLPELTPTAVRAHPGRVGGGDVELVVWDFSVRGGSLGVAEADAVVAAVDRAVTERRPLITLVRTGGTRLDEGVAALVGMARLILATQRLAEAGVPHLAIADQPTTGGVFVTIVSRADVRVGIRGATVGFAGPRIVAATGGGPVGAMSHTAETAVAAGLLDDVLDSAAVPGWLTATLAALGWSPPAEVTPSAPTPSPEPLHPLPPALSPSAALPSAPPAGGWETVRATRAAARLGAAEWIRRLSDTAGVVLGGADPAVQARLARLAGRHLPGVPPGVPAVLVALGATPGARPGPGGYALLTRAARLAGRLGLALIVAVDTPGAAAGADAENAGVAAAIGEAMAAVLACPSATIGVLLGEGGSGGALAGLVCDRVVLTATSYFAALAPEGAAAALRCSPEQAAERLKLRPRDIAALGVADVLAADGAAAASTVLTETLPELLVLDPSTRLRQRRERWSAAAPGTASPAEPRPG